MYHDAMGGIYSAKLSYLLKRLNTGEEVVKTAGELEIVCKKLSSHIQAIVDLTPPESEDHKHYKTKLAPLQRVIEESRRYQASNEAIRILFSPRDKINIS